MCAEAGENLGIFITGDKGPLALAKGANYAARCAVAANEFEAKNEGKCKHYMYNYFRPGEGCQCCISI